MAEATIDAVVFDVGGVLLDWDPRHLYRKVIADPDQLDHFLTEVCPGSWHSQHDGGTPFSETIPARQALFPDHADLIDLWWSRYLEMTAGEVSGSAAIVDEVLALGVRGLVLSNMPAEVWPDLRAEFAVLAKLEGAVISGEERVVKPAPAIFERLLDRFGLVADRTVFVDDVQANVDGAVASGIHGLRFTSAAQLRTDLRAVGVMVAA